MTAISWDFQSLEKPQCHNFDVCSVNACPLDDIQKVTVSTDAEKVCQLSKAEIADLKNNNNQKKLTAEQKRKVTALIKRECCNCSSGNCDLLDYGGYVKCPQIGNDKLVCKWFVDAVLPLDTALDRTLTDTENNTKEIKKKCVTCGKSFTPGNNRAKYCPKCQANAHAARQREYRLKLNHT